jgi:hypothetical protein
VKDAPHPVHVLPSEVFFGSECVVGAAPKLEILEYRPSAERIGLTVVDLEAECLTASRAAIVAIRAARTVAIEYRATGWRGDVTTSVSTECRFGR